MQSILYVSKATQTFDEQALRDLLQQAEERNRTLGITGYLYFKSPYFFQYIESEDNAVETLMDSIAADTRHSIINQLHDTFSGERRFPDWSMRAISEGTVRKLNLEQIIIDDVVSMNGVYRNEERWKATVTKVVTTLARNRQSMAKR
ncbi:BLUF domain-containing protein [Gilvimarinus xylanilyticus]|uniref:BLUF domain-containing protein n=1 Tax=Gilvimarinus xylanilyticus TaxID=2944139 RepID=A0A9X2KTM2_9GAMM|nr:BLUF domain-containing protein [Gilvimarinus xylanilyticus]MCP8900041.1 BLUF domain-containing protein [Gilvimarinus xylanilyticus]